MDGLPRSPPPPPLPLRTEPSINKTPKTFRFPLLTALQLLSPPGRGHRVPVCHRSDAVGPGARVPLGAGRQHRGPKMGTCGFGVLPMMRHGPGGDMSGGNGVGTTGDRELSSLSAPLLLRFWPPRSPLSGEGEAARRGSKPERKGGHLATENPKTKQAQT